MSAGTAVSLVLSVAALGVSLAALLTKRKQDRRDLFLKMHERLIDADLQEGRRRLRDRVKSMEDAAKMRVQDPDSYQLVGRALAMFDILGGYVARKYIDERLVLEEWGHTYARSWAHGRHVVDERFAREGLSWSAWPHLQAFGEKANRWAEDHPHNDSPRIGKPT